MVTRILIVLSCLAYWSNLSQAGPYSGKSIPQSSSLIFVQDGGGKANSWHSPKNSLDQFPFLSPQDCVAYGKNYGYTECAGARKQPRKQSESEALTEANQTAAEEPDRTPQDAPLPERRTFSKDRAAPSSLWNTTETATKQEWSEENPAVKALSKKIGKLLLIKLDGPTVNDDAVKAGGIAGAFLQTQGLKTPAQLRERIDSLQSKNAPPIIMLDSAGYGTGAFASSGETDAFPSPYQLSSRGDALYAFNAYRGKAVKVSGLGVSMVIGPQADICAGEVTQTADCYGKEPRQAAAFASAFIFAHRDQGLLTAMRYTISDGKPVRLNVIGEIAEQKIPDALVIDFASGSEPASDVTSKAIAAIRSNGFSGAIILDKTSQENSDAAGNELVEAIKSGFDMVLFGADDLKSGLRRDMADAVQRSIESGELAQARFDAAIETASSLTKRSEKLRSTNLSQDNQLVHTQTDHYNR